ncbi:MAG: hypothetical protein HUU06_01740, partial [Planctomycetaceae bacterium]|nr:hypothetical protein [Planctomycetaceae bacterium]
MLSPRRRIPGFGAAGLALGLLIGARAFAQEPDPPPPPAPPPPPPALSTPSRPPAAELVVPHIPHRVQVDGVLTDWDTGHPLNLAEGTLDPRPGASARWKGPADASAALHLCWDDERLYVGGRVTDDQLLLQPRDLWMGDSVEVFLRLGGGGGRQDYQFVLAPLAQDLRWTVALARGKRGLSDGGFAGVEVAGKEVRDDQGAYRGYTFEAALPLANFPGFDPAGGSAAINLVLVDADGEPGQKSYLLWSGSVLPAYDPSAVVPLRFEGTRSEEDRVPETGFLPGLQAWRVPASIVLGTVLLLGLLYLLRRPLRRLADLPLRRKLLFAAALGALLPLLRSVPGLVEARR